MVKTVKARKRANSIEITIPKEMVNVLEIDKGATMLLTLNDGAIRIVAVK